MTTLLKIYNRLLQRYPLITSSVQTGILMATGDVIAQTFVERKSLTKINLVRTAQFGSMGIFFAGPGLTTWYRILAARFGSSGLTPSAVLKKVASDQLIFAPIFIGVFLATLGVIKGQTYEEIQGEIKRNYTDILISNYKLWPWVQIGNFYVTPVRYQILVVQVVAIFWNTYLSWKTQSDTENLEIGVMKSKIN